MKVFRTRLSELQPRETAERRWVFIPYDQLSDEIGPLSREKPEGLGIVLVENRWQLRRRPYHRQKLAWILAHQRQFALEQAARGVAVRYEIADGPYRETLNRVSQATGGLRMMEPAEREMRADLAGLVRSGALEVGPHEGWLTTHEQFLRARKTGPPWRMDVFYKFVRRETGILMRGGRPLGGKFSFDPENRKPWKGSPKPPDPPSFEIDDLKAEIGELVESEFGRHPGRLDLGTVPASAREMRRLWEWARRGCLPYFGPYEDAMSSHSTGLFHTRLATAINLHRLPPKRVVERVARLKAPLASREGFIRQVLGWREFIRHVHLASDGFRELPGRNPEVAKKPGDGGYSTWAGKKWPQARSPSYLDGGAKPHMLGDDFALPPAYWGTKSGLTCLDSVVADVWWEGWSHHITRLVVLGGLGTLLDVNPRELTDWFWVAYIDSHDWVVEPNVLGMGMFAIGDYMSTKPYVTGAAYINKMSDFCEQCAFNPAQNCPIASLYWAFLARHEKALQDYPRMTMPLVSMRKRSGAQKLYDRRAFRKVRDRLGKGQAVSPGDFAGTR